MMGARIWKIKIFIGIISVVFSTHRDPNLLKIALSLTGFGIIRTLPNGHLLNQLAQTSLPNVKKKTSCVSKGKTGLVLWIDCVVCCTSFLSRQHNVIASFSLS